MEEGIATAIFLPSLIKSYPRGSYENNRIFLIKNSFRRE